MTMSLTPEYRYEYHKKSVERYLRNHVAIAHPRSLYMPCKYILSAGGKRIRPVLALLACEAVGGAMEDALPASAAIEILHTFTLVHDDIMDHAPARRGRSTVHTKWDESVALLTGDILLGIAYRELLATKSSRIQEILKVFTDGMITVCEGQAMDKEFETRNRVHVNDYLCMIEKKTGRLVSVSTEIGSMIGSGTAVQVQAMRRYGFYVGRAFQVQDDLLDIIADEKEFGKVIGGDLQEGKKTYLLLEALRRAKGKQKKALEDVFHKRKVARSRVAEFRRIYEETGAISSARAQIENDLQAAKEELAGLPSNQAQKTLLWFADKMLNRKY